MVTEKNAWEHSRCHVASYIVLRPLGRLLVEHALKEAYQALAEVTASEPLPGRLAALADIHGVEDQAYVF